MIDTANRWVQLVLALFALATAIYGWLKIFGPPAKAHRARERAKDFALLGGPVYDPLTGKQIATQPPIGQWMSDIKTDVTSLSGIVHQLVEQNQQLADHARKIENINGRVISLEAGQLERIVTKAESAQMWRAVADKDIDPDQIDQS